MEANWTPSDYHDDGITLTQEETDRRNQQITEMFNRLNSSVLLTLLFENIGELSFDRKDLIHLNNYDMPPSDTSVNPYDVNFTDYIKDIGGHVNVYYNAKTDKVTMRVVSYEEGIHTQKNNETVGFFSIRRPWNVYGVKFLEEKE
jgi:hypothetical protein